MVKIKSEIIRILVFLYASTKNATLQIDSTIHRSPSIPVILAIVSAMLNRQRYFRLNLLKSDSIEFDLLYSILLKSFYTPLSFKKQRPLHDGNLELATIARNLRSPGML